VPRLDPHVAAFLARGVAIVAATRDADLQPEITRAWGPAVVQDGAAVTLCLGDRPGARTRANLEHNAAIAATFSLPTTYRGVQLKGTVTALGEPTEADLGRMREHVAAFAAEVVQLGIPPDRALGFLDDRFLAVTFTVAEVYDQTPGPLAGAAWR
jgi:hypothetical protein